mmetsp:Transcript_20436/g.53195  ORF Transcript_20436/g.53195 Transcript_20436/m.53195 type:complete len:336 (+) Transcript_20436:29-1036(+)
MASPEAPAAAAPVEEVDPATLQAAATGADTRTETDFLEETFLQTGEGCSHLVDDDDRGREGLAGWYECPGENFNLRVGPNYKKHGKKAPSLSAMFREVSLDWYKCDSIVSPMGPLMDLPVPTVMSPDPEVPSLFIMTLVLPQSCQLMRPPTDGPCIQVVFVAEMTEETAEYLRDIENAPGAYQLFKDWCREGATKGSNFHGRFKIIGTVLNWEEVRLPQMAKSYNSKPALVKESGTMFKGTLPHPNEKVSYVDWTVNIFKWGSMARKGIDSLKHRAPEVKFNVCTTIEAKGDHEMPERCLFSTSCQFLTVFDDLRRLTPEMIEWLTAEAKKKGKM